MVPSAIAGAYSRVYTLLSLLQTLSLITAHFQVSWVDGGPFLTVDLIVRHIQVPLVPLVNEVGKLTVLYSPKGDGRNWN